MNVLHRFRFVLLGIVAVGLIVGGIFALRDNGGGKTTASAPAGALGPTPGPNSAGYVSEKKAYLSRIARSDANENGAALVSFTAFRKPADVEAAIGSMKVSAVFVKFPSSEIEALQVQSTVDAAVGVRASLLKRELTAELPQLEQQLKAATGSAKADIAKLVDDHRKAIASVVPDCACVFAVAVENSTLSALETLQTRMDIKLVDVPDPVSATLRGWQLTPLVPKNP